MLLLFDAVGDVASLCPKESEPRATVVVVLELTAVAAFRANRWLAKRSSIASGIPPPPRPLARLCFRISASAAATPPACA